MRSPVEIGGCAGLIVLLWATGAAAQTPLWRKDVGHLAEDRAAIAQCLAGDAPEACVRTVQMRCAEALGPDTEALTTVAMRRCEWRAIAAWEDEMAAALGAAATGEMGFPPEGLTAAQNAWEVSMLADVRLQSQPYEGGSLQGLVAAGARADAVARRTLWLRQLAGPR